MGRSHSGFAPSNLLHVLLHSVRLVKGEGGRGMNLTQFTILVERIVTRRSSLLSKKSFSIFKLELLD